MSRTRIRKAEPPDLPEMQEIARRTIDRCYRSFLGDEGVDWFISSGESDRELRSQMDPCDVLLKDGEVVAFTIYLDDLIHLMMVDAPLHRSGLGSQLRAHSERKLFTRGHSTIRLETFKGNQQAINFYLKNGWVTVGEEKDKEHNFIRVLFEKRKPQPE